ncbi:amino acid permease/ SLC12A domain-containing protein [Chytriomyces sp. MP71]|nr:amino acid permease/ SLC12A domain-containing protein [Chytriomyces sp. MP71]
MSTDKVDKAVSVLASEEPVLQTQPEGARLHRKLQARHLEMIAIGGTIGTGLLLRSGGAIATAGPVGALVSFSIVGIQVFGVAAAIGEMCTYMPVEGAFSSLPTRFVSPAFGFASGWNYWINWALTFPAEMQGIASLMGYWVAPSVVASWVWSLIFMVPVVAINLITVTGFAETEFVLCIIKIVAIVVFAVVGFCVWFGAGANSSGFVGFKHWNPPVVGDSPVSQFINFSGALSTAFYSYGGTEMVGITAGEAANPRVSVPRAINGTIYRIFLFYIIAIFLVGVLLDASDPVLAGNSVASSPFVWVYSRIGISAGADIMNAVIIAAAASAANSSIYACSRTLLQLAAEGSAPRALSGVTKRGVPAYSVLVVALFGLFSVAAAYAAGPDGSVLVFNWLSGLVSYGIMAAWCVIVMSVTHLRFRRGFIAQGYDLSLLRYKAPFFPYLDYASLTIGIVLTIFLLMNSFYVPSGQDASNFFNTNWWMNQSWIYCGVPITVVSYFGYAIVRPGSTRLVPLMELDFEAGRFVETSEEMAEIAAVDERPTGWRAWGRRILYKMF